MCITRLLKNLAYDNVLHMITAKEMQRRSVASQKKVHGKSYKQEMARRGKLGGRPKTLTKIDAVV